MPQNCLQLQALVGLIMKNIENGFNYFSIGSLLIIIDMLNSPMPLLSKCSAMLQGDFEAWTLI
jgi:hypothetical protein